MESQRTDLEWLVDSRNEVQSLLLSLHRKLLELDHRSGMQGSLILILVGCAFSLWRAVFLTEAQRPKKAMYQHAEAFLRELIADNAINYVRDKRTRSWSAGYYLNNAFFRLAEAYKMMDTIDPIDSAGREMVEQWLQKLRVGSSPRSLRVDWETAFDACEELLLAIDH